MVRHTINITGTGTIEEIQQALSDIQEHIDAAEESGEHHRVDDLSVGFPKTEMEVRKQKFQLTIKLK